ncbi:hypothetical protein QYF36_013265 [Acer negundo]|nr:hypothetical protein QYF36_013265 [Acer negundo]
MKDSAGTGIARGSGDNNTSKSGSIAVSKQGQVAVDMIDVEKEGVTFVNFASIPVDLIIIGLSVISNEINPPTDIVDAGPALVSNDFGPIANISSSPKPTDDKVNSGDPIQLSAQVEGRVKGKIGFADLGISRLLRICQPFAVRSEN